MDIGPEEFKALEPRLRSGKPLLQIADFLVNGAVFSRRLASDADGEPMVAGLVRSMVMDDHDPLARRYFEADHPEVCARSCYRCLERYGNRGLLDWRPGLSYLRAMLDADWSAGLDGDFGSARELADWSLRLATNAAEELRRLNPVSRSVVSVGPLHIPAVVEEPTHGKEAFVVVHPFWRLDDGGIADPLAATREALSGRDVRFVDTFDAARRPVRTLDIARRRNPAPP